MFELPPAIPLFDSLQYLEDGNSTVNQHLASITINQVADAGYVYEFAVEWLLEQRFSENNYKTYRSELTTFLHWAYCVEQISVGDITRRVLNRYLDYCANPPTPLIAYRNVAQFITHKQLEERIPNVLWRPFLGKKRDGVEQAYQISDKALKTKLAILSSFFFT